MNRNTTKLSYKELQTEREHLLLAKLRISEHNGTLMAELSEARRRIKLLETELDMIQGQLKMMAEMAAIGIRVLNSDFKDLPDGYSTQDILNKAMEGKP